MMREQDEVTVAWQRPGPTSRQRLQDLYLGILVAVGSLLSATLANSAGSLPLGKPPPWPEQLAWSVGVTLPLIWRRVWPEASLLVVAVGYIGAQVRGNPDTLASSSALFIAIYTLGAWGRHRRLGVWLRIGVIVSMFIFIAVNVWMSIPDIPADAFPDAAGPLPPLIAAVIYNVLFNLLFFLFAYFYGDTAWTSARRQHDLEVQAEELRRSQAERAERAVIGERVRIARELHDVVAHHVSVMGVQAAACRRVFDKDPTQARTALSAVEETARTAIDELRRMLGVLRNAGGTEEPTSPVSGQATPGRYGLDQVESLVRSVREAGLTVRYESFGTPKRIPDSVSLAAYRVVQEALTNTIKHARASRVDIRIRHLEWEIEVDVTDDGRGVAAGGTPARMTGGLGLIGMHERVTAHDGVLEVGPRTAGGFRVRARLPLTVGAERSEVAA